MRSGAGLELQGLFELFATGGKEQYILCFVFIYLDVKDFSQILVVGLQVILCTCKNNVSAVKVDRMLWNQDSGACACCLVTN